MTVSAALFFVGRCLTLGQCPERIGEVRDFIRSDSVVWEQVVWVSTGELVFPALYMQLNRAGLLQELPFDLVDYMEEFTALNRDRNRQIIEQAREITELLNRHEIFPIFLKGTAHLLDGLYEDISERMVGDIDLLVDEKLMVNAAEILIASGYEPMAKYDPNYYKIGKHYPRLANNNCAAAVEVHRQIILFPFNKAIGFELISKESGKSFTEPLALVPCNRHQIIQNILNFQVNDFGYYYGNFSLRQCYDLLLLSERITPLTVVREFGQYFHRMNANLAIANTFFADPPKLPFQNNWQAKFFIFRIRMHLKWPRTKSSSRVVLYYLMRVSNYPRHLIRAIFDEDARTWLFIRLSDPKRYIQHFKSYRVGQTKVPALKNNLEQLS